MGSTGVVGATAISGVFHSAGRFMINRHIGHRASPVVASRHLLIQLSQKLCPHTNVICTPEICPRQMAHGSVVRTRAANEVGNCCGTGDIPKQTCAYKKDIKIEQATLSNFITYPNLKHDIILKKVICKTTYEN